MIVFDHTKHKELWNMIINLLFDPEENISTPAELKVKAFRILHPHDDIPEGVCYACQYDVDIVDMFTKENQSDYCDNCPLIWPDDRECDDIGSLYHDFMGACYREDRETAIQVAETIRDLPIKEEVIAI